MEVEELAAGLWRWSARHPEWSPGYSWDPEVSCFYVEADDATLVVDPLVPSDEGQRFWTSLDRDVERRELPVAVLLTQAAHTRSAGDVAGRYGAVIWGHEQARDKIGAAPFEAIRAGDDLPGARVLDFAQDPGGSGTPLYFPSHRAVAIGDVFIAIDGELRYWWGHGTHDENWYRERLAPSIRRWLELPIDHVLVAHGDKVRGGGDEIVAALERRPHYGE